MSFGDQFIAFTGNLAADPAIDVTPTGRAVVKVRVIVNTRVKQGTGYADGEPNVHNVIVWEGLAENLAASCKKGDRVNVIGQLSMRTYEVQGANGPERRSVWEVTAEAIGPDLRYASAKVQKMARASAGQAPTGDADPFNVR